MRSALLAPWMAVLVACGPTVRWRARSPDLRHRIEVRADGEGERAYLDAIPGALYAAIGTGAVVFTDAGTAFYAASDGPHAWRVVGPSGEGPTFLEVALPLRAVGDAPLYVAADRAGWHVVHGADVGPASSGVPTDVTVLADRRVGYVARDEGRARFVLDGAPGPTFASIELVRVGDGGARVLYAGVQPGGAHIVSGERVGAIHESVLELAGADGAPAYAAILGIDDHTELLHHPASTDETDPNAPLAETILFSAPLLSHLRLSDDGAHVACLSSAPDGRSIELLLDGAPIARHRRLDGETLAFVPGSFALVWVSGDAQGLVVHARGAASERYERIDGPFVAQETVGFIGHRGGRAEVWIDGAQVADETYAAELRVGPEGRYAFMVRQGSERFVVTPRGRWPLPRFFIDTLTLDASGEHWAALVPDAAERVLSVWIDGEPRVEVPAVEVLEPALAMGLDPATALRAMVRAVLAAR